MGAEFVILVRVPVAESTSLYDVSVKQDDAEKDCCRSLRYHQGNALAYHRLFRMDMSPSSLKKLDVMATTGQQYTSYFSIPAKAWDDRNNE